MLPTHVLLSPTQELQIPGEERRRGGSAHSSHLSCFSLLRAPLAPSSITHLCHPQELGRDTNWPLCPTRGPRLSPSSPDGPSRQLKTRDKQGPALPLTAWAPHRACRPRPGLGDSHGSGRGAAAGTWAPKQPVPPPRRPRGGPRPRTAPAPQAAPGAPRAAQAPPRPRPPPAPPAPPARRGPRKAVQSARSPRQEILAGLGAAEGAAAPGSGGSGIIFYQRRDQLPHPVTGPYTKAQTDLEKLGRPGGVRERRGAGMGPYRAAGPAAAAATTTRGAGGRRSSAPKSPTQKSPLRLAEGHGEREGGAP